MMESLADPAALLSQEENVLSHKLTTVRLELRKKRINGSIGS